MSSPNKSTIENKKPMVIPSAPLAANPMLPAVVTRKLRPILFSTPMVEAILSGRKSQTRRLVNTDSNLDFMGFVLGDEKRAGSIGFGYLNHYETVEVVKAKYNVGDVLWVRETFAETCDEMGSPVIAYKTGKPRLITACNGKYELCKETDTEWSIDNYPACGNWKPSLFMPFFACRIFLKITDIRVERLQEISIEDAKKEGVEFKEIEDVPFYKDYEYNKHIHISSRSSFATLWYKINGQKSWDKNPFVWVVEFEVCPKP